MAEPGLPAGTVIGRYRLVEEGPGPTRHTYRATSTETGRPVVLTFLAPLERSAERSFDQRAAQLINLRHPGIASMLAYGVESGSPYVVHDQVAGQPLGALLDRSETFSPGPMPLPDPVPLTTAVPRSVSTPMVENSPTFKVGMLSQSL